MRNDCSEINDPSLIERVFFKEVAKKLEGFIFAHLKDLKELDLKDRSS